MKTYLSLLEGDGHHLVNSEESADLILKDGVVSSMYSEKPFALDPSWDKESAKSCLRMILSDAERKKKSQDLKNQYIRSNQELRELVEVEQIKRRAQEESKRKQALELKKANADLRKRIFFLKSLNEAVELNDVVSRIQREVRKVKGLGDAILLIKRGSQFRLFFMRGRQIIEKTINEDLSGGSKNLRQILADHMNRPVGPLIQLKGNKSQTYLLIEHQLLSQDLDELTTEWKLRMVGLELVIDRFQLTRDLSEAALFWEKTFDGLGEPIGIFDSDNQVIRANHLFTSELMALLDEAVIRFGSQVYHVESYPIHMDREIAEGSKVIHLSDQSSTFQLKQHMIQTEKIAALGLLAGHIAHELNNPLTGIRSLCQVLMKDESLTEEVRTDLGEVEAATQRCQNIIRNLLEYSRPHGEDLRVATDVNEIVANTLPLLKSLMGKHRSEISLAPEPLRALVDPHMLQQVVFNLVANACQAMSEKGMVSVQVSQKSTDIVIRIQDSGPGVPEELKAEIFEPFFTTKAVGDGTGLGLSLSLNVIRGFGGDLRLDSNYKSGAAFEILLPRV